MTRRWAGAAGLVRMGDEASDDADHGRRPTPPTTAAMVRSSSIVAHRSPGMPRYGLARN